MVYQNVLLLAKRVRKKFERKEILQEELEKLYLHYNPIRDITIFIKRALEAFPRGNCGLTSVYLRQFLPRAEIVRGYYEEQPHTFLLIREKIVVDITADQFGGQEVYVGPLCEPWKR